MSIELQHVLISFAFMGALSLCGVVYSYLLVAKEVGSGKRSQARRRKAGNYRRNIPLIAVNLVGAYGLTGLGMYYLHDLFINESVVLGRQILVWHS